MNKKIGIEAEYVLLDKEGSVSIVPSYMDRDGMPLLGEIRGEPANAWYEAVANFHSAYFKTLDRVESWMGGKYELRFLPVTLVDKDLFREASKEVDFNEKKESLRKVKNVYGTDMADFTDQVAKDRKIIGQRISCGLHIHFSYQDRKFKRVERPHFEKVHLPLSLGLGEEKPVTIPLYKKVSDKQEEVIEVSVSKFTWPAVNHIVRKMDEMFFDRFAPEKKTRTKYRQPGFYEVKPYGFEYRSLPASRETIDALPEITQAAFSALDDLDRF